jgi:uncharacterized protein YcnI
MKLLRSAVPFVVAIAALVALAAPAAAHVTVNPREATRGSFTKLTFRVPNEKDTASTTKVEVEFPAAQPVASVSVKPLTGWTYDITRDGDRVSRITWTAAEDATIDPGQFQEFDVSLGPLPQRGDAMVFKALQTYSDGEVVRWIEEPTAGGAEPEHPAPVLTLTASASATTAPAPATAGDDGDDDDSNGLAVAALVLGALGLVTGGAALARTRR